MDFRHILNTIDGIEEKKDDQPKRLTIQDVMPEVGNIVFAQASANQIKYSSANNPAFANKDINDPNVKSELFNAELKKSPGRLIGEIGERIKPIDDTHIEIGNLMNHISEKIAGGQSISKEESTFAMAVIKKALKEMPMEKDPDQSEYKDDEADDEFESRSSISKAVDEAGKLSSGKKDPCWKGYEMVGTKKKGGKEVPNCVPKESIEVEANPNDDHDDDLGIGTDVKTDSEKDSNTRLDSKALTALRMVMDDPQKAVMAKRAIERIMQGKPLQKIEINAFGDAMEKMMEPFLSAQGVTKLKALAKTMNNSTEKSEESVEENWFQGQTDVMLNGDEFYENFGWVGYDEDSIEEAEYQGRSVKLNKPMRGDVKKFKVYVKNPKGNVVKVNFGDPDMKIKAYNPKRRKSFRARHNCDTPGPKTKARYWSCKKW